MRFKDCKYTKYFFLTTDHKGIKCKFCFNQIRAINATQQQFVRHIRLYHPELLEEENEMLKGMELQQKKEQNIQDEEYLSAAKQCKTFIQDP